MTESMTGILLVVIVLAVSAVYAFVWYRREPHREQLKRWLDEHHMSDWLRHRH
jgi:hypothetical protein